MNQKKSKGYKKGVEEEPAPYFATAASGKSNPSERESTKGTTEHGKKLEDLGIDDHTYTCNPEGRKEFDARVVSLDFLNSPYADWLYEHPGIPSRTAQEWRGRFEKYRLNPCKANIPIDVNKAWAEGKAEGYRALEEINAPETEVFDWHKINGAYPQPKVIQTDPRNEDQPQLEILRRLPELTGPFVGHDAKNPAKYAYVRGDRKEKTTELPIIYPSERVLRGRADICFGASSHLFEGRFRNKLENQPCYNSSRKAYAVSWTIEGKKPKGKVEQAKQQAMTHGYSYLVEEQQLFGVKSCDTPLRQHLLHTVEGRNIKFLIMKTKRVEEALQNGSREYTLYPVDWVDSYDCGVASAWGLILTDTVKCLNFVFDKDREQRKEYRRRLGEEPGSPEQAVSTTTAPPNTIEVTTPVRTETTKHDSGKAPLRQPFPKPTSRGGFQRLQDRPRNSTTEAPSTQHDRTKVRGGSPSGGPSVIRSSPVTEPRALETEDQSLESNEATPGERRTPSVYSNSTHSDGLESNKDRNRNDDGDDNDDEDESPGRKAPSSKKGKKKSKTVSNTQGEDKGDDDDGDEDESSGGKKTQSRKRKAPEPLASSSRRVLRSR
jgi:hypothetical protein